MASGIITEIIIALHNNSVKRLLRGLRPETLYQSSQSSQYDRNLSYSHQVSVRIKDLRLTWVGLLSNPVGMNFP